MERGFSATDEEKAQIDTLASKLERLNPNKKSLEASEINGKWKLLYTTSQSILGQSRPFFLRPLGPIHQFIGAVLGRATVCTRNLLLSSARPCSGRIACQARMCMCMRVAQTARHLAALQCRHRNTEGAQQRVMALFQRRHRDADAREQEQGGCEIRSIQNLEPAQGDSARQRSGLAGHDVRRRAATRQSGRQGQPVRSRDG